MVVETATSFDAHRLCGGDLHRLYVMTIPQRLENAVGEAKRQNVLYRFLAEIMIDPVDLALVEHLEDARVERLRARQILAEGLLDHHAPETAVLRHEAVVA